MEVCRPPPPQAQSHIHMRGTCPLGVPHIPPNTSADLTALPPTAVSLLLPCPFPGAYTTCHCHPSKHQAPSSPPSPCFTSSSVNVSPLSRGCDEGCHFPPSLGKALRARTLHPTPLGTRRCGGWRALWLGAPGRWWDPYHVRQTPKPEVRRQRHPPTQRLRELLRRVSP